jgi:hypothetical protein
LNKDEDYVDPSRPCTTWSIKELKGWLKNLGLPGKGQKCELLERVQRERERLHTPNRSISHAESIDNLNIVLNVIKNLADMISNLMTHAVDKDHITQTTFLIKQFLSSYHALDVALQHHSSSRTRKRAHHQSSSTNKPTYTSYNFICLLNLHHVMERYGPIVNLWEGGYSGENYSQQLKPRLRRGMTLNWHVNVLKDVLKEDALSRIELPSGQPGMKIQTIRDSTHVKYKTILDFITRYNLRQPISIIHFSDTWACRIGDTNQYLEITINGSK